MKAKETELHIIAVVLDLLVLNLTILLVAVLFNTWQHPHYTLFYGCFLLLNLAWVLAYFVSKTQVLYTKKGFRPRARRLLKRLLTFLLLSALFYWPMAYFIAPCWLFLLLSSVAFVGIKLSVNYAYFKTIKYYHKRSNQTKRALLIGDNKTMRRVKLIIKVNPVLKYKFVGFLSDKHTGKNVLGRLDSFEKVVKKQQIQVAFVAIKNLEEMVPEHANLIGNPSLLHACNRLGVRLYYVPENKKIELSMEKLVQIDGITVLNPQKIPMDHIENQIKKRAFDLLFSGAVIVFILSWLYPLIGLLIKLSSKGPVLFIQPRTGINKLTFDCYKFRSMRLNPHANHLQATVDDPRITRIGKFLRKSNLDELPQFFNVFKGEMSVVGPRPHMLSHTDTYSLLIEDYLVRHYVKPGITGWAQINGLRGETDELWKMEKRVAYDKEYINRWSLRWDFVIVWKTIFWLKAFKNAG